MTLHVSSTSSGEQVKLLAVSHFVQANETVYCSARTNYGKSLITTQKNNLDNNYSQAALKEMYQKQPNPSTLTSDNNFVAKPTFSGRITSLDEPSQSTSQPYKISMNTSASSHHDSFSSSETLGSQYVNIRKSRSTYCGNATDQYALIDVDNLTTLTGYDSLFDQNVLKNGKCD